eukprot:CAMPEP_0194510996 /NCGR_PEP_ID=MMETSP0253-20130528/42534_1 /TAXON_ID=2966 /ORGANISM="Noctiluca scintillans" /LENGTH=38 /DNA_ID= /DNA_START= /DNA_END= /DNA_ORIENTATION=
MRFHTFVDVNGPQMPPVTVVVVGVEEHQPAHVARATCV